MQVFKLCLKIIKDNIPTLMIYVVVFLGVSILATSSMSNESKEMASFTPTKTDIAFISDETGPLVDGLKEELSKVANFVEIERDTETLQDALYFRRVTYALYIPNGFTERFMGGEDVKIQKTTIPESYSSAYVDISVEKYFDLARLYLTNVENIAEEELVSKVLKDLSVTTNVELYDTRANKADTSYANFYFNYLSYSMLGALVMGMSALMVVFSDKDIKRRNACSPISTSRINMQFILANLTFAMVTWFIMVGFCIMFNFKNSLTPATLYFVLNSFIFMICGTSLSYLIGTAVTNQEALSAVCNVVTLGPSFISGVFVPQELIGQSVLRIASFTPSYWYVKANNEIAGLTSFGFEQLESVFSSILIQLGFAVAMFAVALVVAKRKRYA